MNFTHRLSIRHRSQPSARTPSRSPATPGRVRRRLRPLVCEPLEGRALLANTGLDPSFNAGQLVLTPSNIFSTTQLDSARGVAVEPNGEIVVVGAVGDSVGSTNPSFAVRRYYPNGSPDQSFGTGGEVDIAPGGTANTVAPVGRVLIQPDGKIVVAATITPQGATFGQPELPLIVRLTTTGALDSTFGTNGEVFLPQAASGTTSNAVNGADVADIALAPNGGIVVGGSAYQVVVGTSVAAVTSVPQITHLTSAGAIDPTFHGGQPLQLDLATYGGPNATSQRFAALAVTSQGQTLVETQVDIRTIVGSEVVDQGYAPRLIALNADGTLATTFGTQGILSSVAPAPGQSADPFVVQADGRILLAVSNNNGANLLRFTAAGQPDSSFSNPTLAVNPTAIAVGPDASIAVTGSSTSGATAIVAQRFLRNGIPDTSFGPNGLASTTLAPITGATAQYYVPSGVAFTPSGQVIAVGTNTGSEPEPAANGVLYPTTFSQAVVAQFQVGTSSTQVTANNDYDGDGQTDFAAVLTALGAIAYRKSTGGDVITPFGIPGVGLTIPAPGDYDQDEKTDVAAYLPTLGILAYRPSRGGADVLTRFGPTGVGNAIPVPGDYNGDGRTDFALYLPGSGTFIVDPSGGGAPYAVQFGAGGGQSIPVPGDYDGDGRTDFAVYIPALGEFFDRSSANPVTGDVAAVFGPTGVGASIPAPGDYLGLGRTQFALYLPSSGTFAVLNPNGAAGNIAVPFGAPGAGQSIPVPGDYDGDGRTDFAVYLPTVGNFAYRPSGGGVDVLAQFGAPGSGQTVPTAALAADDPTGVSTMSFASDATPQAAVLVPLVDGLLDPSPTKPRKAVWS